MENFVSVPAITLIVYLLAESYKWLVNGRERGLQFVPIFCGLAGAVLGIGAFFFAREYMPAANIFVAAAIGIASGFAATGVHQAFKQFATATFSNTSEDDS